MRAGCDFGGGLVRREASSADPFRYFRKRRPKKLAPAASIGFSRWRAVGRISARRTPKKGWDVLAPALAVISASPVAAARPASSSRRDHFSTPAMTMLVGTKPASLRRTTVERAR